MTASDLPPEIPALGFRFYDAVKPSSVGASCMQFGVFDPETGALIGITVKLGTEDIMMFPVVPIPEGAVRFDERYVGPSESG